MLLRRPLVSTLQQLLPTSIPAPMVCQLLDSNLRSRISRSRNNGCDHCSSSVNKTTDHSTLSPLFADDHYLCTLSGSLSCNTAVLLASLSSKAGPLSRKRSASTSSNSLRLHKSYSNCSRPTSASMSVSLCRQGCSNVSNKLHYKPANWLD